MLDEGLNFAKLFPKSTRASNLFRGPAERRILEERTMSPNTSPAALSPLPPHVEIRAIPMDEPRRPYARPADVLEDASLDADAKKEVLSFWASDACAVESAPALRQLPGAPSPVSIDEIMSALLLLDVPRIDPGLGSHPSTPFLKAKSRPRRFAW
jgi:hypothetical protein